MEILYLYNNNNIIYYYYYIIYNVEIKISGICVKIKQLTISTFLILIKILINI